MSLTASVSTLGNSKHLRFRGIQLVLYRSNTELLVYDFVEYPNGGRVSPGGANMCSQHFYFARPTIQMPCLSGLPPTFDISRYLFRTACIVSLFTLM